MDKAALLDNHQAASELCKLLQLPVSKWKGHSIRQVAVKAALNLTGSYRIVALTHQPKSWRCNDLMWACMWHLQSSKRLSSLLEYRQLHGLARLLPLLPATTSSSTRVSNCHDKDGGPGGGVATNRYHEAMWQQCAQHLQLAEFKPGEVLCHPAQADGSCYWLLSGRVVSITLPLARLTHICTPSQVAGSDLCCLC